MRIGPNRSSRSTRINGFSTHVVNDGYRNFVLLRLVTEGGLYGLGEGTVEWFELAAEAALRQIAPRVVGEDAFDSEAIVARLYRDSYWPNSVVIGSAISAVDQALWDIKGKATERTVTELLGGRGGTRLRAYANAWYWGCETASDFAARAAEVVGNGYSALKWDPFGTAYGSLSGDQQAAALANVSAVREAVGPSPDLLIEAHGRFTLAAAEQLAECLAPLRPFLFEEPLLPEDVTGLAQLAARTAIPVAAGERTCSPAAFADLFARRAVDVVQPDPSHALGITGTRRVAALAEAAGILFAPHNASGPVGTMSALHLSAAAPNFLIMEYFVTQPEWIRDVFPGAPKVEGGQLEVPDAPGLGIDLNLEAARDHPFREYWDGKTLFSEEWSQSLPATGGGRP